MRPHRNLPSWRRLLLELLAMFLVFYAVLLVAGGLLAVVAMIVTMFVLRATRPKPGGPTRPKT